MVIDMGDMLTFLLYVALLILVISLIVFVIRLTKTLSKVDILLDDVNRKMVKVDGLFSIIDRTTDYASAFSDKVISAVTNAINFVFRRKRGNEDE